MLVNRSRRILPLIPFSSLADLAFILLVFFLLSAHFSAPLKSELRLARAESELAKPQADQIILTLDRAGELVWPARDLSLVLDETANEARKDFFSDLKFHLGEDELGLAIEAECPYPLLRQVLHLLEEAGIESLFFVLENQP